MNVAAKLDLPALVASRLHEARRLLWRATLVQFATSALFVTALLQELPATRTFAWMGALWLVLIARALLFFRSSDVVTTDSAHTWERKMLIGGALVGSAWGASALLMIGTVESGFADEVIVFACAGTAASGMGVYAHQPRTALVFVLCSLVPIIVQNLFVGDLVHYMFAAMTVFYAVVLLAVIKSVARTTREAIEAQLQASELSRRLDHEAQQRRIDVEHVELRAKERDLQNESRYRDLFAHFSDFILFIDVTADGSFAVVSMNTVAEQTFAVNPDEYGQSIHQLLPEPLATRLEAKVRACAVGDARVRYEDAIATPFGPRTLDITITAMRNSEQQVYRLAVIAKDVTDQKRAEQVLRERAEQEARLSAFIASVPGYLFSHHVSADGVSTMRFVSDGINDVYGLRPEDADMNRLYDRIHAEDREELVRGAFETMRTLAPLRSEYRIHHPTKGVRWLESCSQPVRQADGGVLWNGFVQDITERKQVQEKLELLEHAFNNASDAIFLTGTDFRFYYVNDSACRALGYSREELLTMSPLDIDPALTREGLAGIFDGAIVGDKLSFVSEHCAKDGRLFPVELNTVLINYEGKSFNLATARDISERRRMEEALAKSAREFRSLAENAPDNISRYDSEGRITYFNPQLEQLLGVRLEDVIGKVPTEAFPGGLYNELEAKMAHAVATGEPSELRLVFPDTGHGEAHHHLRVTPEFNTRGEVVGTLLIGRDITELWREQQRSRVLEYALDHMHDSAYLIDMTGEVLYVNEAAARELGYAREELQSMSTFDFDPLLTREKGLKLNEALAQHGSVLVETEHQRRNGERFPVEITLSQSLPYQGRDTIMCTARNMTRQKAYERELAERAAELRQTADFQAELLKGISAAGLYVLVEENRKIIYATHGADAALDLGPVAGSEFRTDRDIVELIHPDDRAKNADLYRRRLMGEPVPSQYEIGVLGRNGERLEFELNVSLIPGMNPPRTLTVAKDITARKRMEQELREQANFQEQLLQGISMSGLRVLVIEGRKLVYATESDGIPVDLGAVSGRTFVEQRDFLDFIHPDDREKIADYNRRRLAGEDLPSQYEIGAIGINGERRELELSVNLLPDTHPQRILTVAKDVTERKRERQQLEMLTRAVNHSSDAIYISPVTAAGYGPFVYVNDEACAMLGYSRDELLTLSVAEIDADLDASALADLGLMREGTKVTFETHHRAKDGRLITVDISASVVREGDMLIAIAMVRDITERKRMEQALRDALELNEGVVNAIPDLLFEVDLHGRYYNVWTHAPELLVAPKEVLLASSVEEQMPPEAAAQVLAAIAQANIAGSSFGQVISLPVPKGHRWFELSIAKKNGGDPAAPRFVALSRDVTERKRMEQTLALRERQFRSLAENSPDPIFRYDRECRRVYMNPAVARFVGERVESLQGRAPEAGTILNENDAARVLESVRHVFATGENASVEISFTDLNGERRFHETLLVPERNALGEVETVLGLSRDITAIRENERRMSRFIERLPGFAFTARHTLDGKTSIPFASPGIILLFGVHPEDVKQEISPLLAMTHPEDRAALAAAMSNTEQLLSSSFQFRLRRPGEPEHWIEVFATPERDADGATLWHGIMLDITERKQAEEKLRDAVDFNQGVIDAIPDLLFEVDEAGRYLNVWTRSPELLAAQREQLLGKTVDEVMPVEAAAICHALLDEANEKAVSSGKLMMLPLPQGEMWFEVSAAKKNGGDPAAPRFIVLSRDVTARIRAQEQAKLMEAAINNSQDAVFLMGTDGRFHYVNEAACRHWGYSREELLTLTPADIDPSISREGVMDILEVVTRGEKVALESRNRTKDGRDIPVELSISSINFSGQLFFLAIVRDISERKRYQKQLEMLTRAVNHSSDAIYISPVTLGGDNRFIYVNDEACRLLGYSREELLSMNAFDIDADIDAEALQKLVAESNVMAGGKMVFETHHRAKDGRLVPMEISSSLVMEGDVPLSLAVARDITQRKQHESVLLARAELERRQSQYFAMAPGLFATIVLAPDGSVSMPFVSEGLRTLYGLEPETVMKDIGPFVAACHPDDVEMTFQKTFESAQNLTLYHVEYRIIHPEKGVRWIEVQGMPQRTDDGGTRWDGFYYDITERKAVESQLGMLNRAINQSNDAIFLMDERACFIYVNDGACRALGYSREELLGLTIMDIDPDFSQEARAQLDAAMREGGGRTTVESRHRTKGGRIFPVEVSISVSHADAPFPMLAVVRDITARKQIENTLRFIANPGKVHGAEEFLAGVACQLGQELGVRYVIIDQLADEPGVAQTVALYANGSIAPNMRYALKDTPCDDVIGKEACYYPRGVQALFPKDTLLVDMGAESYAGIPLWDSNGKPLGLIAVIHDAPFEDQAALLNLLRLVGPRVAAEIERNRIERALRESRESLKEAQRISHVGNWELDLISGELRWSDEIYRIFEIDPAQFGASYEAFLNGIHPEDRAAVGHAYETSLANRAPYEIEHRLLMADGRIKYVLERCESFFADDGKPIRSVGTVQDITERKRMEQALQERAEFQQQLLKGIGVSGLRVFVIEKGQIIYANELPSDGGFWRADEITGKGSFLEFVHPDDREKMKEHYVRRLAGEPVPTHYEFSAIGRNGERRELELTVSLLGDPAEKRLLAVYKDITERKQVQQQLELLNHAINQASDAVFLIGMDLRFNYVNDAACRMLGYSREELLAISPADIDPNVTPDSLRKMMEELLKGERITFESHHRTKEGRLFPIELTSVLVEHQGKLFSLTTTRDITERQRVQRELELLNHAINHQNDAVLLANAERRFIYVNDAACRSLGYSRDELLTMGPSDIDPVVMRQEIQERAEALNAGQRLVFESTYQRKDGIRYPVEIGLSGVNYQGETFGLSISRDITERKRTQGQLELLTHAINQSNDAVFLVDQEQHFAYVNDAACRSLGYSREELLSMGPTDIDPDMDRDEVATVWNFTNYARMPIVFESFYRKKDGRDLQVEISSSLINHNSAVFGLTVARDITERKAVERRLETIRRRLESVLDTIPDMVWLKDVNGVYLACNHAFESLVGLTEAELIGKTDYDLFDRELADFFRQRDRAAIEAKRLCVNEEWNTFACDGRRALLETRKVPVFSDDGLLTGVLGVAHEITERHRMEEEIRGTRDFLQSVIDGFPEPMMVKDSDHRWVLTNEAMCKLLRKPREELLGKNEYDLVPKERADHYRQADEAVFASRAIRVEEEAHPKPDGTMVYVQSTRSCFADEDGKLFMISVVRDISERKQMEQLLARREQYQRTLLDNFPFFVWLKDENCKLLAANREYARVANVASPRDLEGMSDHDFFPADLADKYVADDRAVMASGLQKNVEEMYTDEHGVRRWMETWKAPVIVQGRTVGTVGFSRDITERRHMEELLAERERELRTLVSNMPDVVVRYDLECRRTFVSPIYETVTGLPVSTVLGKRPVEAWGPPTMAPSIFESRLREVMATGRSGEVTLEWWDKEGRHSVQLLSAVPEFDGSGRVVSVLTVARDVSDLKRAEALLYAREEAFRSLAENTPDTIARYDRNFRRLYGNPALVQQSGVPANVLIGKTVAEFPGGEAAKLYMTHMQKSFDTGEESSFEMNWKSRDGTERCTFIRIVPERNREGEIVHVLAVGRDISEIDGYRRRIFSLAFYDPMTGLANRALFNDRLHQTLADAEWHKRVAGLMLIDLDRFKNINDSLGHAAGDELLREAGSRLIRAVRGYDTVARLGGDEFAILLPEIRNSEDAGIVANKVLNAMTCPFIVEGRELFVTASVGVALYPDDGTTSEQLLKFADSAMYYAKSRGRNNFQFYRADMTSRAEERLELEVYLRKALANGEFSLHYQPQVLLDDEIVIGAEALLRWHNPELGNITPDRFIGIAEDTGLIVEIGAWVLMEACRAAADWNRAGNSVRVAVNLSTRQFRSKHLVDTVLTALRETGCRPEWLELEITESLLLEDSAEVKEIMDQLHSHGLVFAIDDFGTGYSALGYLRRFPIETIKIDRSFVKGITSDDNAAALVRAIISMTDVMKLTLVAEGVETQQQCDLLREWGAGDHLAQGYLFGKPMPQQEFEQKMLVGMDGRIERMKH